MARATPSQRDVTEKTVCILLVRGESPDGKPIYAYVAVRADKLSEFMSAQEKGMFYPEDHGVIIESGEGEPDAATRKKMEEEYGFNHQQMIDIPDKDVAGKIADNIEIPDEYLDEEDEK